MDRSEIEQKLKAQQISFDETVKQPNTLERNLVLAEHRAELDRLHKLLAKADPKPISRLLQRAKRT